MEANRNRRKIRELVVSMPPSSTPNSNSNTPRALLRNLVKFPKYCIRQKRREGYETEDDFSVHNNVVSMTKSEEDKASVNGRTREEVAMIPSGSKHELASSNLGIGAGLIILLVKGASEFNKMTELRKQMEILIKDIKNEMQMKNAASSSSNSNNCTVISSSCCLGDDSAIKPVSLKTAIELDMQCRCETSFEKKRCMKINILEEELEAELERLQLKTKEDSSMITEEHSIEVESANTNHFESISASFSEISDEPKQEETKEINGVCPRELEKRLHEVLEKRQQERIAELEYALECAERKVEEKETEAFWWRDTARLVSKHKEVMHFKVNLGKENVEPM